MEFSLEQVPEMAEKFIEKARRARLAAPDRATIITFSGNLGAGKTTMIKQMAQSLGITQELSSPTFVIYKKYELPDSNAWKFLIHADMYRLHSADEIMKLGWDDLIADPQNLICVEWPEQISAVVPDRVIRVILGHNDQTRILDLPK